MDWGGSSREKDNGKGERREIDSRKGGREIMGKEKTRKITRRVYLTMH